MDDARHIRVQGKESEVSLMHSGWRFGHAQKQKRKNDFSVPRFFELPVAFPARPRQIYQSSSNVIYSRGVEWEYRGHKDGLSCRIEEFIAGENVRREFSQFLNPELLLNRHLTQKCLCDWKWGVWVWKCVWMFGGSRAPFSSSFFFSSCSVMVRSELVVTDWAG